jgi:hypothetical protein
MNKITKIVLASIASLAITVSSFAGELSLTGSVKASYNIGGADKNASKGFGISNELGIGAAGELDNGITWTYAIALDPNAGGTIDNDDQSLVFGTSLGNIALCVSACGLSTEEGFGIGANGVGENYASPMTWSEGHDVDSYQNIQYHTPAGLIPFGVVAKIAYVGNASNTGDSVDFKADGTQESKALGDSLTMYQLSAKPVDGLNIGADYFTAEGGSYKQMPSSGLVYANYTYGPVKVGYYRGKTDAAIESAKTVSTGSNFATRGYGVQFAVNEQLTVSYSTEDLTRRVRAAIADGAASAVKTETTATLKSIQAAYNIGGATVGIAQQAVSNDDYTAGLKSTMTIVSLAMAF